MIKTTSNAEAIRSLHAEAASAAEKRRRARWSAGLKILGLVLLLAAIAS
jgi:hypothetical protein